MRAVLIYLHRIKGADRKIAAGLERLLDGQPVDHSPDSEDPPTGSLIARGQH